METNGESYKNKDKKDRRARRSEGESFGDALSEEEKQEQRNAVIENDRGNRAGGLKVGDRSIGNIDRQARVIQLRTAGFTFPQIGSALKISPQTAYSDYKKSVAQKNEELHESVEELQFVTHSRVETMINRLWQKAMPNNVKDPIGVGEMDRIIRLMSLDAKIMGYEAPQKRQVDVQMISTSVSMVVEHIIQAIPEEYVQDVYKAIDEGMSEVESLADRTEKAIQVKNTA